MPIFCKASTLTFTRDPLLRSLSRHTKHQESACLHNELHCISNSIWKVNISFRQDTLRLLIMKYYRSNPCILQCVCLVISRSLNTVQCNVVKQLKKALQFCYKYHRLWIHTVFIHSDSTIWMCYVFFTILCTTGSLAWATASTSFTLLPLMIQKARQGTCTFPLWMLSKEYGVNYTSA